jgi:cyclic pyranopterin monophosphate synthase
MPFKQVDISDKPVSYREATAVGTIRLKPQTVRRIRAGDIEKGDPVSLAEVTGVLAVKRTPDIVALCHPLKIESTRLEVTLLRDGARVTARVSAREKTGVEMEALTAVSVSLLNIWDVVKQYEKDDLGQYPSTSIVDIHVTRKVKRTVKAPRET